MLFHHYHINLLNQTVLSKLFTLKVYLQKAKRPLLVFTAACRNLTKHVHAHISSMNKHIYI
jgi:hypothetical protein